MHRAARYPEAVALTQTNQNQGRAGLARARDHGFFRKYFNAGSPGGCASDREQGQWGGADNQRRSLGRARVGAAGPAMDAHRGT